MIGKKRAPIETTPLFSYYQLNPNLQLFLDRRFSYHKLPTNAADNFGFIEDFEQYHQYYSPEIVPRAIARAFRNGAKFICFSLVLTVIFIYFSYRTPPVPVPPILFRDLPSLGVPNPDKDPCIKTYWEKILDDGSPDDVNKVKPHNIRVIAGIGDSLTIGSRSANSEADFGVAARFPGNAFFTGADDGIEKHITLHNILQCLSSKLPTAQLIGGSHGNGMDNVGFDVAIGGMKIDDFPRQAAELVAKISTHPKIKLDADWKLVSVFFGTNDVGKLSGHSEADPISREVYKAKMEEGLSILKKGLPRTIVSIVAMFQPQLLIEAGRIIETGERPGDKAAQDAIDEQCSEYQQVAFEVQNEGKFDSQNFTVVVQPFAVDIKDAFRNAAGSYDKSFYAWDEFHLSKLGNAIIAKALWKNLLEPVGAKNTRVDLADMQPTIACVNVDFPYIRTVGNSK